MVDRVPFWKRVKRFFIRAEGMVDTGYQMVDPYEMAEKIQLLREMKNRFRDLVHQDHYPYPDFVIERIQSVSTLSLLTYIIADEIGFELDDRRLLLSLLDETDRAKLVLKRLHRLVS